LAVSHIFSSRLSQEIFWLIWVGAGAALLLLRIYGKIPGRKLRFFLEISTGAGGIMLIWTMSRLYMIPTVQAWNTAATPSSFYLTALISGSGVLLITVIRKYPYDSPIIIKLAGFTSVFVVLQILNFSLWGPGWGLFAAGTRMRVISLLQGAAGFRLFFSLAGVFLLLLIQHRLKKAGKAGLIRKISAAALLLILLGELIGRWIFYAAFSRIGL
jgi:DMSO reductase anchor subunit